MENIEILYSAYPWLKDIAMVIVIARIINKPLFIALSKYVKESESTKDNELFNKVITSKWYKIFSFVMDYSLSIKMPKKGK